MCTAHLKFRKYLSDLDINHFIDIGCGPGTSSVAFAELKASNITFHLLDIANAMLNKAVGFIEQYSTDYKTYNELKEIKEEEIEGTVVLNFSFLFANVDDKFRLNLETLTDNLKKTCSRLIIINQNSPNSDLNIVWDAYRKYLENNGFNILGASHNLKIEYSNSLQAQRVKTTNLSYEILSN